MLSNLLSILLISLLQLLGTGNSVEFVFVGDAMQHAPQNEAARKKNGTYDYSSCFSLLEPDIKAADYAVVNLETTLGGAPYTGYPCFSAPDEFAWQLKRSGFDLFLTANNHCLDRRNKGLVRTIATLDKMKIPHIGTYVNAGRRARQMPFIVTLKGIKVAFLNYTYGTNGIGIQKDEVVDMIDLNNIENDIEQARAKGAQAICVNMHWGTEYVLEPTDEQRSIARWLVDRGVDLVIGGHPHVLEPFKMVYSETYRKNVLVVYSMGNFISAQKKIDTHGGAMVKVCLKIVDGKPVVCNPRYKLFYCQHPTGKNDNYKLIPENMSQRVRSDAKPTFNSFMSRAHALVMKHNKGVPQEK